MSGDGRSAALLTCGEDAPLVLDAIPQPTLVARDVNEANHAVAAGPVCYGLSHRPQIVRIATSEWFCLPRLSRGLCACSLLRFE